MQKLMKIKKGFTLIEVIVVMAVFLFIIGAALGLFLSVVQSQKKVLAEQQLINQVSYIEEYMSKALRMAAADDAGNCLVKGETAGAPIKYIYLLTRPNSSSQYNGIRFLNQSSGDCQEFFLDNFGTAPALKELKGANGYRVDSNNESSLAVPITSSGIQIDSVRFSVNKMDGTIFGQGCSGDPDNCGATSLDSDQPRVTILLNVLIPNANGASCSAQNACAGAGQKCNLDSQKCATLRSIQTTVSQRNLNVK